MPTSRALRIYAQLKIVPTDWKRIRERSREVMAVYHVTGATDFLIHVAVRDAEHLRDLAMTAFTAREEVSHIETELIFEHVSCQELPSFL